MALKSLVEQHFQRNAERNGVRNNAGFERSVDPRNSGHAEHPVEAPALDADGLPFAPCERCGGRDFWRPSIVAAGAARDPRGWGCVACAPPPAGVVVDGCSLPPAAPGLRVVAAAARPAEADGRSPPRTGTP